MNAPSVDELARARNSVAWRERWPRYYRICNGGGLKRGSFTILCSVCDLDVCHRGGERGMTILRAVFAAPQTEPIRAPALAEANFGRRDLSS